MRDSVKLPSPKFALPYLRLPAMNEPSMLLFLSNEADVIREIGAFVATLLKL